MNVITADVKEIPNKINFANAGDLAMCLADRLFLVSCSPCLSRMKSVNILTNKEDIETARQNVDNSTKTVYFSGTFMRGIDMFYFPT